MIIVVSDPVLGKNIRYLRRKYGLSRRSLAKLLGMDLILLRQAESPRWPIQGLEFPYGPFMRLEKVFPLDINRILHEDLKHPLQ